MSSAKDVQNFLAARLISDKDVVTGSPLDNSKIDEIGVARARPVYKKKLSMLELRDAKRSHLKRLVNRLLFIFKKLVGAARRS